MTLIVRKEEKNWAIHPDELFEPFPLKKKLIEHLQSMGFRVYKADDNSLVVTGVSETDDLCQFVTDFYEGDVTVVPS